MNALLESLLAGLAVPLSGERVFFALQAFGYPRAEMIGAAAAHVLGFTLAQAVNWGIGRTLSRFRSGSISEANYARAVQWARYASPMLLFAFAPMGGLLSVVAGFLRVKLWWALALAAAGKAAWFGYFL